MLCLSLFPGIGLMDRGFEAAGFSVVRGPDLLWGGDVRGFHIPRNVFTAVFGGPPCQDFSGARRDEQSGEGYEMLDHFRRLVTEGEPDVFVMENVNGVPWFTVPGYKIQRINLNARECGVRQNRPRVFHFGSKTGKPFVIRRRERIDVVSPCCMATEGQKAKRRDWSKFCELQGLPPDFELPGFTLSARYRAVGNGVPVPMAALVAGAVAQWLTDPTWHRACACGCGRILETNRTLATGACRQRMSRRSRDSAGVTGPSSVTSGLSPELFK
jgi:DNA (cytosine-5)-methyltransferase 1